MSKGYIYLAILVMALATYAVRVAPMVLFSKKIQSNFIRSFLYYVPYAVLSAMTFPAIFYCTQSLLACMIACAAAIVCAWYKPSLVLVAAAACITLIVCSLLGI
jgi:branched-subunit amino acid transport protein